MADTEEPEPKDAKLVKAILRSMGVQQFEQRVVNQFLEFWYRYVVDVLGDAEVYAEHASKGALDCDDVNLAIQSRVNCRLSRLWQGHQSVTAKPSPKI